MSIKNIRIITPSWLVKSRKELALGVKTLERLGFTVKNGGFTAKLPSEKERAAQIHAAFKDKATDLILAQRGGYSSLRILPYIDYALIKRNRKPIAGFSDMSTLLNSIYERTGMVTLHAPMLWNLSEPTTFTMNSFLNALDGFPNRELFSEAPVNVLKPGKASGTLKCGNLVTLTSMTGTEWEINTDGTILFLEDIDEKPHQIDRWLSQCILNGKFKKVNGLILGDFRGTETAQVFKVLTSQLKLKIPVVHCPYIGHVKNKITLPVGAKVTLDTARASLLVTGPSPILPSRQAK